MVTSVRVANSTDTRALLLQARFSACLAALEGDGSDEAIVLRLRALLGLGRNRDAIRADLLTRIDTMEPASRCIADGLVSSALHRSSMLAPAQKHLSRARTTATSLGAPELTAEISYIAALQAWSDGDLIRAESELAGLDTAKAIELSAWIAAKRLDFKAQSALLRAAWAKNANRDAWVSAQILQGLSALARELCDTEAYMFCERELERMAWTEDTTVAEMLTNRHLGWAAALDGRYLLAYQRFERSLRCAPTSGFRAMAHTDRAYIAFLSDESKTAESEILAAEIAANETEWSSAGEARMALLLLAELRAPQQVTTARAHLEAYRSVATPFPAMLPAGSPTDTRRSAMEHYTTGVVERAEGKRASAIAHFREAFTIWRGIGYKWRAALAAVHLGDLSLSDVYYECAAVWMREEFPRAWFGRSIARYATEATHPDIQALNAGQRAVLRGILDGKRNKEIAEILDLSPNTVRNRIAGVMKMFGASSRTQLIAELRSRSLA